MKKLLLGIIPVIMLAAGCYGNPPAVPVSENSAVSSNVNSGLITLDQALNEAANRIDERIPTGSKIAPLNFNSPHDKFSDYVLEELTANLVDSRNLIVVDRRDIDLIRNEFDFQFSGEVGDDSMQQIGRMLGAQSIISGNFTDMGGFIRIMIRVLNVQNASVEVQYRANIISDTITTALLTGGRTNVAAASSRQNVSGGSSTTQVSQAPAPQVSQAPTAPAAQSSQTSTPQVSQAPTTPVPQQVQQAPTVRYTVTFNVNGASGTAPSVQTVQNGETMIMPDKGAMINTRGGTFEGWNTRIDGTGTFYAAGDTFVVNANIQLYARWIERVYNIGDIGPAGGLVFYDKGFFLDGWRYMEAASGDVGSGIPWSATDISVNGTNTAVGTGKRNTELIRDSRENVSAALVALHYNQGGFNDWFLPSRDELNFMYTNLKQRNLGNFSADWYWSSSQGPGYSSYCQRFSDGIQAGNGYGSSNKREPYFVRPVRAF